MLNGAQTDIIRNWRLANIYLRDIEELPEIVRPNKVVAVGHRGTQKLAPENTLRAHEVAYALGARAIEFDVRCTKDGHFVVIHDRRVDRTTTGRGLVKDMTLSEIRDLDAGLKKGIQFAGERVPTLREALRNVRGRFVVDIDFKGGPRNSAEILHEVLEQEWSESDPLLTIFARPFHFGMLKPLCPKYALRPHYFSSSRTQALADKLPLEIMCLRRRSFSARAAAAIRQARLHLFCNVMGRDDNARGFVSAIRSGALFIQTDHLDRLTRFLSLRNLLETRPLGRNYAPIHI
ncbi:MAG: hypothetical protein HKN36_05040 [Hellea sp.]|nr:hypothetical protein [Hellea sp.]